MIHIGIDGNEANVVNRVGSNQYAYGILHGLSQLSNHKEVRYTVYLKQPPLPDLPKKSINWHYRVIPPATAWTQWRLPLDLYFSSDRPDIFFSPGHYAPRFSPIPTVVTIMDLAFLKMPQLFLKFKRGAKQLQSWTEYSVKHASAIIAISRNTKKDVASIYHYNPKKITVAYPGIDRKQYHQVPKSAFTKLKARYQLNDKYILHLGTLQPRKNIIRLIQAFEQLPKAYKNHQLVLVGQSGWLTDEITQTINQSPKRQQIITTGFVEPEEIPVFMANAQLLVLVGLYEGFGMPPAEALACGTLSIVSNNSSLPEVVGESGIFVDPYSVASIKNGIMIGLKLTDKHKQARIKIGQEHIKQLDWLLSAKKIQTVLEATINNHQLKK